MISLVICTPHPVLFSDKIEKNYRGGACSTYVERCVYWGLRENLRERDYFEDPGLDVRIILRWIFRK
jgi:hypothetical protein